MTENSQPEPTAQERAEELLAEVCSIARSRLALTRSAAKHANLVLVDRDHLALLEQLLVVTAAAFDGCLMTREYKDMIELGKTDYDGKRWLLERDKGRAVYRVLEKLSKRPKLPMGCAMDD